MSTFRPPVGPIQPTRFFTPGAPGAFVPASLLQMPSSPRVDMTAQIEQIEPFFTAGLPLGVPPPQLPAYLTAGAVYFRAPSVEPAILQEVLPLFTPAAALGRPGAPILQLPIASVRSELAALDEVLPPFLVPIAPSSFVPFSNTPNVAAYAQRDRASEIAAIDESLPLFTPAAALGRPGAPILQLPIGSDRRELAALDEVLPPFLVPAPTATFVGAISVQLPAIALRFELAALEQILAARVVPIPFVRSNYAQAMQPRARDDLAALEEVLPPFAVPQPPIARATPPAIAMSLYVRREDPTPLMQPARRSIPLPPVFLAIDPETTLEASYQQRLQVAPFARAILFAPYKGKQTAPYDPALIIVSHDGRKLI